MHIFKPYDEFFDADVQDKKKRKSSWFIYLAAFFIRPVVWLWTRYEVVGKENIPAEDDEPVIFACNHISYADPVIMWLATYPRITRFLGRSSLFRFPILRGGMARVGCIPINPDSADRKALKRAVACIKRGECIGIYPEGTRMNSPEKEYHPHAGLILIAHMAKCKIVPVGIVGTDRIKPKGKWLLRPAKCRIAFGEPIDPVAYDELPKSERTQKALDDTMETIFALRDSIGK